MRFLTTVLLCISAVACSRQGQDLRLYEFDCGRLNYDSLAPLGFADARTAVRTLVTPCYVIEHSRGRLLWEGGFQSNLANHHGWQEMAGGWRIRLDRPLREQLGDIDLTMSDFDYVAFSHFHFDHVGVANELDGASLIIQRAEKTNAFADSVIVPGFQPALYDRFGDHNTIVIDGDYDVFGDGSVMLVSTPGHTAGHQSLFVDLPTHGAILLTGDLHILRAGRRTNWIPSFNADSAQTAQSIQKIDDLLRQQEAELWIGHDLERFDSLRSRFSYFE